MRDTLEREKLPENVLDRLFAAEERIRRLEELLSQATEARVIVLEPANGNRYTLEVVDYGDPRGKMLKARQIGRQAR